MQHLGGLSSGRRPPYEVAVNDFYRARARASLQELVGRLQRKPVSLMSFNDVAHKLQVTGRGDGGRQAIPLVAIMGSVGRYNDFTRTFLPRLDADAHRWARVKTAELDRLPPITVYQIDGVYFVLDGNHRVSVARELGLSHIDAEVIRVQTRVPLAPGDDPDTLIVKAERAAFLARTQLDVQRPGSELRVSAAGQFAHLENHIEAYRYRVEEAEERTLSDAEAALRWYDEAYLPVVEVIREQGILRYFPGRTETDLYVWIAANQAALRDELGQEAPPEMVANYVMQKEAADRSWLARLRSRLRRLWRPQQVPAPPRSWAQEHVLARYSGALFADVLVSFSPGAGQESVMQQALLLAEREGAHVQGLLRATAGDETNEGGFAAAEAAFYRACREAGVRADLVREAGAAGSLICRRSLLCDVVVMGYEEAAVRHLLRYCRRPFLVAPGNPSRLDSVLLVYDGTSRAQEALFAATYMAEAWGAKLVVGVVRRYFWQRLTTPVRKYLALHEVGATFVEMRGKSAEVIERRAQEHGCDLIAMPALRVVPSPRAGRRERQVALQLLQGTGRAVLVFS